VVVVVVVGSADASTGVQGRLAVAHLNPATNGTRLLGTAIWPAWNERKENSLWSQI
jgi:hypothetical protein